MKVSFGMIQECEQGVQHGGYALLEWHVPVS